eukprot:gene16402-56626_t
MAWRYIGHDLAGDEDDGGKGSSKDEPAAALDYSADVPGQHLGSDRLRSCAEGIAVSARLVKGLRAAVC